MAKVQKTNGGTSPKKSAKNREEMVKLFISAFQNVPESSIHKMTSGEAVAYEIAQGAKKLLEYIETDKCVKPEKKANHQ